MTIGWGDQCITTILYQKRIYSHIMNTRCRLMLNRLLFLINMKLFLLILVRLRRTEDRGELTNPDVKYVSLRNQCASTCTLIRKTLSLMTNETCVAGGLRVSKDLLPNPTQLHQT